MADDWETYWILRDKNLPFNFGGSLNYLLLNYSVKDLLKRSTPRGGGFIDHHMWTFEQQMWSQCKVGFTLLYIKEVSLICNLVKYK